MGREKNNNAEVGENVKENRIFEKFIIEIFLPKHTHWKK